MTEQPAAGDPGESTPPAASGSSSGRATGGPANRVRVGTAEFAWPVPDRLVDVGGRRLPVEVAVVAALHGGAALWLLIELWPLLAGIPDALGGLVADEFSFFFSWLILLISAVLLYVVAGLGYTAVALFRLDPVGRDLCAVLSTILVLLLFTDAVSTPLVLIALVSVACTVVLFVSPWTRRTFTDAELRRNRERARPSSVVLAQTLALSYFSLLGVIAVFLLPGMRFASTIGGEFVAFELLTLVSVAGAGYGVLKLSSGPDRTARLLITGAVGLHLVAQLVLGTGALVGVALGALGGIVVPLWLVASARRWFGDAPLTSSGPSVTDPDPGAESA